uniref:Uncharacterized protein orf262 n=1 Tax=Nyctotherus ovalis TaxID=70075 RepID=F1AAK7_NYCOV|nr:hypothetical protein [Nyctotherus ovalis]
MSIGGLLPYYTMYTTYIKSIYAQTFAEDAALLVRLPPHGEATPYVKYPSDTHNYYCASTYYVLHSKTFLRYSSSHACHYIPSHCYTSNDWCIFIIWVRLISVYIMFYMFFFNAGMLRGTFLTLAHTRCGYDAMALNYFVYNQGLLKPTLNPADLLPHRTTHIQQAAAALKYGVDFVFVVDGTLSEGDLQTILATQLPIVGIGATPRMLLFYDIYIPLYAGTPVLQHYFLEYALYAYISGRRYSIRQQHEMICALYNSLLS